VNIAIICLIAGFVGGALVAATAFAIQLMLPAKPCGGCGELLPKIRRNPNRLEALRGITRCPKCGCKVDAKGRKVGPPPG
jgi:hypothetical protein